LLRTPGKAGRTSHAPQNPPERRLHPRPETCCQTLRLASPSSLPTTSRHAACRPAISSSLSFGGPFQAATAAPRAGSHPSNALADPIKLPRIRERPFHRVILAAHCAQILRRARSTSSPPGPIAITASRLLPGARSTGFCVLDSTGQACRSPHKSGHGYLRGHFAPGLSSHLHPPGDHQVHDDASCRQFNDKPFPNPAHPGSSCPAAFNAAQTSDTNG